MKTKTPALVAFSLAAAATLAAAPLGAPSAAYGFRVIFAPRAPVRVQPLPQPVVTPAPIVVAATPAAAPAFQPVTKRELLKILRTRLEYAELQYATTFVHDGPNGIGTRQNLVRVETLQAVIDLAELLED